MFPGLQKRWKVSGWRLLLVLATFAVGGSATGYVGKRLMSLTGITNPWAYIPIYILVVTLVWPIMVILVSMVTGQFGFFQSYLSKMGRRIIQSRKNGSKPGNSKLRIALFASGTGSNAQKIIDHFKEHPSIEVGLIVCNRPGAGVLEIAQNESIPILLIEKENFFKGDAYASQLKKENIGLIVLAGFLWKIPSSLVKDYRNRIINIHPALLPKFGGKGLYGKYVHEAVIAAGESETGITIHFVDEFYDHGQPIFQEKLLIEAGDTAETLAKKVQAIEHLHFARIVEEVANKIRLSSDEDQIKS